MVKVSVSDITISKRKLKAIVNDPKKTASVVNLVYVNDTMPGIQRIRSGESFEYLFQNRKLKDKKEIERIRSLVIPPAWENVWICKLSNGHLQATGLDSKQRKQYRYHAQWMQIRNSTKFSRMYDFGMALPLLRQQVAKDLSLPGLPLQKVLALVVSLMEKTCIRVGNGMYEKLYGSFGLTTLKDKHVNISRDTVHFYFIGKKGIEHRISLSSKRLSKIIKQCRDIPGKDLFQYLDENGNRKKIESGMVNEYIKQITGGNFTAKDFRTWGGTVHAVNCFKEAGFFETQAEAKRKIVQVMDNISTHLGNTRNTCKRYYVHPIVVTLYENRELEKYYITEAACEKKQGEGFLSEAEEILIRILQKAF